MNDTSPDTPGVSPLSSEGAAAESRAATDGRAARATATKMRIREAYWCLVGEVGHDGLTLEQVATRAEVSKGGLLYHFPSKDALRDDLLTHFDTLLADDLKAMRADPKGPTHNYLTASLAGDSVIDRSLLAIVRLAYEADSAAIEVYRNASAAWEALMFEELGDPDLAHLVAALGDGLGVRAVLFGVAPLPAERASAVKTLSRLLHLDEFRKRS